MIDGKSILHDLNRDFVPENSDHKRIFISSKNFDEFFSFITHNNAFSPSKDKYKNFIYDCFQDNTEYIEGKGLFFIQHLNAKHIPPLCFMFVFFDSSPKWWESVFEKFLSDKFSIPRFIKPAVLNWSLPEIESSLKDQLTFSVSAPDSIFYPDIVPSARIKSNLNGSTELPSSQIIHLINYAMSLDGWDDNDWPFEFLVIGNEELPLPRIFSLGHNHSSLTEHTEKNNSDNICTFPQESELCCGACDEPQIGSGCYLSIKTDNGSVIDFSIIDAGEDYHINDVLEIILPKAKNAAICVTKVEKGKIKSAEIVRAGTNYRDNEYVMTYHSTSSAPYPFLPLVKNKNIKIKNIKKFDKF